MSDSEERRRRDIEIARREQREASQRGRESQDIGRWFHYGMAELRGETRENGWRHEEPVKGEKRRHDASRTNEKGGLDFVEYKGGSSVGNELTMDQIGKDRSILKRDPHATGTWVLREGAAEPALRRELAALVRDFPERFHVVEVTKEQAKQARRVGQELSRDRHQIELVNSQELRRDERARQRRERIHEKQRTREAAELALEKQEQERRIREAQQQQRDAADRIAAMTKQDREAAQRGEKPPMTGREAADILAVSRPTPGVESAHRHVPEVNRGGRDGLSRERDRGPER